MTKFIFIFVIIGNIFASQLYAIEHLTEHGYEDHEHNEMPCELNIFYEDYKLLDSVNNYFTYLIKYLDLSDLVIHSNDNFLLRYNIALSRAPPYFPY